MSDLGSTAGTCLDACPIIDVCTTPERWSQLDCECYTRCIAAQSDEVQRAVVDALECERPAACR